MLRILISALVYVAWVESVFCKDLGAHVHGAVNLDIAVEKNEVLFMLSGPAESFLGFEYRAKTAKEKALVGKVKNEWKNGFPQYFGKKVMSDCKIKRVKWEQEFAGPKHSSVFAEGLLSCKSQIAKRKLTVSLKSQFKRIQVIKVQLLGEAGQIMVKKFKDDFFSLNL